MPCTLGRASLFLILLSIILCIIPHFQCQEIRIPNRVAQGDGNEDDPCLAFTKCNSCIDAPQISCQWCQSRNEKEAKSSCRSLYENATQTSPPSCDIYYEQETSNADSLIFSNQCDAENEVSKCMSHSTCFSCVDGFSCIFYESASFSLKNPEKWDNVTELHLENVCLPAQTFILGRGLKKTINLEREARLMTMSSFTTCYFGTCWIQGFLGWYITIGTGSTLFLGAVLCFLFLNCCLVLCLCRKICLSTTKSKKDDEFGAYTKRYQRRADRFYERIQ